LLDIADITLKEIEILKSGCPMLTIKPTICYKTREVKAWNDIMFR